MHYRCEGACAFQIRRGDMHLWADNPAAVDELFDFQIVVRFDTSRGANRRHPQRQIKTRETSAHVRIHRWRAAHGKEHVVMHSHQARQYGIAFEIQNLRCRFDFCAGARRD